MADLKPLWAKDPLVAHSTSSGMGDHAALESLEPLLITYLQLLCKLTCAASCTACLRDLASGTTRSSPVVSPSLFLGFHPHTNVSVRHFSDAL